eukprot:TRINITY_DN17444_c0_g1_i1.p1 TRINITY_DN17444_c0_g1~~TRINITY_DN17444_c0_g1_i1.p1  ORF type:complete len:342 (+),score=78.27 TRINITY_DN17444_c0_g1_i1:61-1086(+)
MSTPFQQSDPQSQLVHLTLGFITSQAISVGAKLHLADHLKDSPKSIDQLAAETNSHTSSLFRLLRVLMGVGIFQVDPNGLYKNTPMSEYLLSDHPQSFRAAAHMLCDEHHWRSHGNLNQSVKTGQNAFELTFGLPIFPYLGQNQEAAKVFDESMTSLSRVVTKAVAATYDFSQASTVADIGGGHGLLLSTVLIANPKLKGILFDQQSVVDGTGELLKSQGVADRVTTVSGDFFRDIPVEADVYLMKNIIHDWNDEQAVGILNNLGKSAKSGAKLLLVESVVEGDLSQFSLSKLMDLNMMAVTGGKERTAAEYEQLFQKTAFRFVRVIQTPSMMQIVEAIKS